VLPTPPPNSGPLSQDYDVIENSVTDAVLTDLDGDGQKEILYAAYDGRVHAYWLDKTQHGNWPFKVPGSGIRFASEPVVADLDNDGKAEVIFTSWPENGGNRIGQLHILDYLGDQLYAVNLPAPGAGEDWNGGLGAPTIANIDADADMEVVVGTTSLISCATSSNTNPLRLTRGVMRRITPVSRSCTELTIGEVSSTVLTAVCVMMGT